jgi:hypothetical protein
MPAQSWTKDIADYLDAGSTSLTAGTNLFVDVIPDEVRTVTLGIFEELGATPDRVFGDSDAFTRPTVRLIARTTAPVDGASAPDPTVARRVIWDSYRRLKTIANGTLNSSGWTFGAVQPTEAPYLLDVDEEGRQRHTFRADVWLTPSTGAW